MDYLHDHSTVTAKRKSISNSAKILIAATGGVGIGLSVICASFVAPAFRRICLPYVPATTEQVRNVLSFLPKNSPKKLLDIGSGDGRIVVAAAKKGLNADGVELNPWLVWYSRLSALRQGVYGKTHFYRRDLWKYNVAPYEYVVIFGVEQMMKDLEKKLIAESSSNAKIIACRFPLPNLQPQRIIEEGVNTVWFYDLDKAKSTAERNV
ncbi:ATP synthase subunit C lysine N-methyltransferase [Bactrocera neohumeralis]|uniref:ATP synthase subunit C lysine N-methyltransferase n=1 Tax=Bactrocera neohumeralis TaxID=98809 RepID=UPI002165A8EA|nr:ATP synthase subunit C lysine N-methyltransferase [Bactrocera neohumeralis]